MSQPRSVPGKLVDGLFRRVLWPQLTKELIDQLADAGLDVSAPAHHPVPREVWYRAIELTGATLYPQDHPARRLRHLGRHVVHALKERDLLKGPWLSMARLMGPRRAMKQGAQWSEKFSPVPIDVHDKGGKELEVVVGETHQLEFLAGLLEGLVILLGGKTADAHLLGTESDYARLRVTWQ